MTEQELKKCPACGGEAEFSKYHAVCNYLIICNNCEIMQMEMDECKVLEAWNNQPRIEELKQRIKELEQALKEEEAEVKLQTILLSAYKRDQMLLKNSLTKMLDLIESYRTEVIDFELHKAVLGFDGMKQLEQAEQLLKGGE